MLETTFKERYNNQTQNACPVSIKNGINKVHLKFLKNTFKYNIQWKVAAKVDGNANLAMLELCLREKLWIMNHANVNIIFNKMSELINLLTY